MANKIALLVKVELTTRVVVDENATDEEIALASKKGLMAKIENDEILENMVEAIVDKECPYGSIEPVFYRNGDVHDFLLDCELITTDGMEIVIEKCAELLEKNPFHETEVMVDSKSATINLVKFNLFNEKNIVETITFDLNKINGFCKDCINDFDDKQMCSFCKGGSHITLAQ
jgi:hypothetical protein